MATIHKMFVALTCIALTGCSSLSDRRPLFGRHDQDSREEAYARKKLKDPRRLDLAYAKWQEQLGNLTEARERYQRVLHDEPQSVDALLGLARLDHLAGRTAEAEQGFRKALKQAPNDAKVLDALGQFYASQEKWPLAIDSLKQSLQLAPNDNTVRFHLAVAMAKAGDIAGARPHFVNSIGEAEADYNLGLILHDQGKLEQSEQFFVQAAVKKPTLEQAQYWLNEIRVEKETKQLLAGTSNRARPDMQAPNGALPTNTNLQPVAVQEKRLSPQDVLGVQPAGAQSLPTQPINRAGYSLGTGATATNPANNQSSANTTGAGHSTFFNPFASGKPPAAPVAGHSTPNAQSLTPQQLEQLRNQR